MRSADTQLLDATAGPLPVPGSGGHVAGREVAYGQYLDSMTHRSHRCVPPGMPHYWPIWQWLPLATQRSWGFPPTAHTETQMRLSHALLAFSGVVWEIDRTCQDDVHYDCLGPNSTVRLCPATS